MQKRKDTFLETHPSLYWKCQFIGWGLVSIYWAYIVYVRDNYGWFYTALNYIADVLTGVGLTHVYKMTMLKKAPDYTNLKQLILKMVISVVILAVLYMFLANIKWYAYWLYIHNQKYNLLRTLVAWNPVFITGLRLLSIWLLGYHLYHYHINQISIIKSNARLSTIVKQAQLDHLSAQLNPHFLFNSLNSIKSLIIENPKTARRAIDLLSDLLRSSIYNKKDGLTTVENEIMLIKDYIELEKLRFEERLEAKFSIDPYSKDKPIPALSIQLLVENAIKHGISHLIDGGRVSITVKRLDEYLSIIVENPGSLNLTSSKGLGLSNLQNRLELQYKHQAKFHISEFKPGKVTASITLPL